MVTKPVPIWERWMQTAKGREKIYTYYYVAVILVNAFIVIGVMLFMWFWMRQ
ncbi:MAG: hypothetical protein OXR66_04030 [Candidatus Woesearchaeota archaeon]|nr:hypothetical protein [Candidatus Woesearchaeota archaeon]